MQSLLKCYSYDLDINTFLCIMETASTLWFSLTAGLHPALTLASASSIHKRSFKERVQPKSAACAPELLLCGSAMVIVLQMFCLAACVKPVTFNFTTAWMVKRFGEIIRCSKPLLDNLASSCHVAFFPYQRRGNGKYSSDLGRDTHPYTGFLNRRSVLFTCWY